MSMHPDDRDASEHELRTVGPDELAALEAAAADHGHRIVRLDLADCPDKQVLLARASAAFAFPDWFGHNWDALSDSLRDLSWLDAPGYLVVISSPEAFAAAQPEIWRTLCEVLSEVERDRESDGVPWRTVQTATSLP